MSKPTITSQKLSEILSKSHKVISEKLSPEEYAEFTDEIAAHNSKIEDLNSQNSSLTTEIDNLKGEKTSLTTENTTLKNDKVMLEAEVNSLKPFKAKIEQIASVGKQLPGNDSNSQGEEQNKKPANHPDAIALANLKASGKLK